MWMISSVTQRDSPIYCKLNKDNARLKQKRRSDYIVSESLSRQGSSKHICSVQTHQRIASARV
jgi:hypothetical protein